MIFEAMIGFSDRFMSVRPLRIIGRRNIVLPSPFPALLNGKTAAMLPTLLRILASAGMILAGKGNAGILAL